MLQTVYTVFGFADITLSTMVVAQDMVEGKNNKLGDKSLTNASKVNGEISNENRNWASLESETTEVVHTGLEMFFLFLKN